MILLTYETAGKDTLDGETEHVATLIVLGSPEDADAAPDVDEDEEDEDDPGEEREEAGLTVAAEHDEADHQETGALHQQPGGQPGGAGGEDESSGGEHCHSGQEDDEEDDHDGETGGGDGCALLVLVALLSGDQSGDLLQSYGGLSLVLAGLCHLVGVEKTNQNMEEAAGSCVCINFSE